MNKNHWPGQNIPAAEKHRFFTLMYCCLPNPCLICNSRGYIGAWGEKREYLADRGVCLDCDLMEKLLKNSKNHLIINGRIFDTIYKVLAVELGVSPRIVKFSDGVERELYLGFSYKISDHFRALTKDTAEFIIKN